MPRYRANGVAPKIGPYTVFVDSTAGVEMVVDDLFIQTILDTLVGRTVSGPPRPGQRGYSPDAEARRKMSEAAKKRAADKKLNAALKSAEEKKP